MSRERDVIKVQVWRLVLLWVVMLGLFGVMVSRLWSLQIAQTMEFQRRLSKQSLRSVRLPGIRGRIYDRTGAPLVEIVTEPDFCTPHEAMEFLKALRAQVRYVGSSECSMETGTMRVDANISVLATYMGHVEVRDLYWYFSAVPELMSLVRERF